MNKQKLKILDLALDWWEYVALIITAGYKKGLIEHNLQSPPFFTEYSPEFRNFLVNSFGQNFDYKFVDNKPEELYEPENKFLMLLNFLPFCFYAWVNDSRRVYHIPNELQLMFLATSIKNVNWEDIKLPFNSFVITLDKPLLGSNNSEYSCILIATIDYYGTNYLAIMPFDRKLIKHSDTFSEEAKKKIQWAIRKKRWEKIRKKTSRIDESNRAFSQLRVFKCELLTGNVLNLLESYKQANSFRFEIDNKLTNNIVQLIMGLCFYLKNFPSPQYNKMPSGKKHTPKGKKNKTQEIRLVTHGAQIFHINTEHLIDSADQRILKHIESASKTPSTVSPHFRTGFWRRPHGKGNDPLYPKTIWVKPTIVNFKLIKEGVPHASKNTLK